MARPAHCPPLSLKRQPKSGAGVSPATGCAGKMLPIGREAGSGQQPAQGPSEGPLLSSRPRGQSPTPWPSPPSLTAAQDRLTGHPTVDSEHQAPMGPAMAPGRGRAGSHAHPESGTPRQDLSGGRGAGLGPWTEPGRAYRHSCHCQQVSPWELSLLPLPAHQQPCHLPGEVAAGPWAPQDSGGLSASLLHAVTSASWSCRAGRLLLAPGKFPRGGPLRAPGGLSTGVSGTRPLPAAEHRQ